jgi:hypothetical protein
MFLDQDKFPKAFEKGDCYNICDEKLTWKQVCTKKPFAISLACETEEKKNETQAQLKILGFSEFRASHYSQNLIYEMLTETGFTEEVASRHSEHEVWPLIAVNDVFLRRLTSSEETGGQKREKRKVKT